MKDTIKVQELDSRTKEELIRQIGTLAKSYVPEWKFDPLRPDAGTALALIFADQFLDTVRRYNRIPEKHRLEFFSHIGLKMLPSVPAQGYVIFGLSSDEFGGTRIPKGTRVMGPGRDDGDISYETTEALEVIPAKITHAFLVDGDRDLIEKKEWSRPFFPFLQEKKNLQEHVCYLCQNAILDGKGESEIRLDIKLDHRTEVIDNLSWLLDKSEMSIAYGTEFGFEEFAERSMEHGSLILKKKKEQREAMKTEIFGKMGYWICCRYLKEWKREPFLVEDIRLSASAVKREPDFIITGTGEQVNADILLFGECPQIFSECYFASAEVFGKAGAKINMAFCLEYEKIPMDNSYHPQREWKLFMKRSDFMPDPEYDITVEQVVWEYYNGSGWSRLPLGTEYQTIFNGRDGSGEQQVELEFTCPPDISLLEWQAGPSRYIRVRVLRMNNLYKLKGFYITPVISNVSLGYSYTGSGHRPDYAVACNNLERMVLPVKELERGSVCWELFRGEKEKERTFYLGFHQPLIGGPLKVLLSMEESIGEELPHLRFEYSGKKGFHPLQVVDETEGMKKSGCLTFIGAADFGDMTICNETAFWIRIIDENGGYRKRTGSQKVPKIEGIFMNAAKVIAVEHRPAEFFEIEPKEKNKVCRLLRQNIWQLNVWVNELAAISPIECEAMKREGRIEESFGLKGQRTGIWVLWEEIEDFCLSGPDDRHYMLDKSEGTVTFSDGKCGAIPSYGTGETIRIEYSCGGGEDGNQPPWNVNGINGSFGYVNSITNPKVICGGHSRETVTDALQRGKEAMRHCGRAVTASDYEALAYEASRSVQKVRCYPNYNERGEYEPGSITIVLLQKEYQTGRMYFEAVKEEVKAYISCRMGGNEAAFMHLYVAEPQFLELDCQVLAVVREYGHVFEVQRLVRERLEEFIHPVRGNYHKKGWEIGVLPNETQVLNALKGIPHLLYIRDFKIAAFINSRQGRSQIPLSGDDREISSLQDKVKSTRFGVGLNGKNEISVIVE